MAKIRASMNGGGGGGASEFVYLKTVKEVSSLSITVSDLQAGKEYQILLISGWPNASYNDYSAVTVSSITNSSDLEAVISPTGVYTYGGGHSDYSMYKFKATSTSVIVNRGTNINTDVVIFERA